MRKSKRIPNAKQTKKLGGIPYFTNNNKKKINKNYVLQESQTNKPNQQQIEKETTVKYGQLTMRYGKHWSTKTLTDYFGSTSQNNRLKPNPPGGGGMWNVEVKPFHID